VCNYASKCFVVIVSKWSLGVGTKYTGVLINKHITFFHDLISKILSNVKHEQYSYSKVTLFQYLIFKIVSLSWCMCKLKWFFKHHIKK